MSWKQERERGGALGIRITFALATFFGRRVGHWVAYIVAWFFVVTGAGKSSRSYLARVFGRAPTLLDRYRLVQRFCVCVYDAFLLAQGKTKAFRVAGDGTQHLHALREQGRGALLIGAHLGSFYAMRARAKHGSFKTYALVFTQHARRINEALQKLDPEGHTTLIELEKDNMTQVMLRTKELIESGALVAILADRCGPDERSVLTQFLGIETTFPAGPFLLAALLRCPTFLTFGFLRDNGEYQCVCEPFYDPITLPRGDRENALQTVVARYAERLEFFARKYPYNWFNFFEYWPQRIKS